MSGVLGPVTDMTTTGSPLVTATLNSLSYRYDSKAMRDRVWGIVPGLAVCQRRPVAVARADHIKPLRGAQKVLALVQGGAI
jgi:hypothetical protein